MQFDPARCPVSRFGSYLSLFQPRTDPGCGPGIYLRTHHAARVGRRDVMRLELLVDGRPAPFTAVGSPAMLELAAGGRRARLCIADAARDTVRVRGEGAGLRLRVVPGPGNVAQPVGQHRWSINARASICRFMVEVMAGGLRADCPWQPRGTPPMTIDLLPDGDGRLEAAIDRYMSTWVERDRPAFGACVAAVGREWAGWLASQPSAPPALREAWELAACVNWSSVVRAGGLIKRPAMLMSKCYMDNVWSWDHCFNAMALCYHAPQLALEQWRVMFDRQDPFGALPDALNPSVEHFNYSKPPVHGWALEFMLERQPKFFTKTRLRELYGPLAAGTAWWLTHRRRPGDALPYYLHGNDSGWDNSTMFDAGAPLAAPDLAALLAVQCEVTGRLAARLGRARHARSWREQSRQLIAALLGELWKGERFVARRLSDGLEVHCDSLVPWMPVVLGRRLPKPVAKKIVAGIRRHLTQRGLATELTASPQYCDDGYWRGPIWAPCTMIAVDGLARLGETKLARTIAGRFCRLCARSGYAENFDALTGAPLRDPAYTWTASVFLVLAREHTAG
jgi:putative isomerase